MAFLIVWLGDEAFQSFLYLQMCWYVVIGVAKDFWLETFDGDSTQRTVCSQLLSHRITIFDRFCLFSKAITRGFLRSIDQILESRSDLTKNRYSYSIFTSNSHGGINQICLPLYRFLICIIKPSVTFPSVRILADLRTTTRGYSKHLIWPIKPICATRSVAECGMERNGTTGQLRSGFVWFIHPRF